MSPPTSAHRAFSRLHAGFVGRQVIRRLAYMTGLKLFDERAYESHDYRHRGRGRREEILHYDSVGPEGIGGDFEGLWNRINRHNRKPNAVVARTLIGSLVFELGLEGNRRAVNRFVASLRERFGVAVVYAIHDARTIRHASRLNSGAAAEERTNKNIHAHIALSFCKVFADGSLGAKVNALDPIAARRRGLPLPVDLLRPLWEECLNGELERAGLPLRVDMRTLREQGVDDEVTTPLGPVDAALEREGIRTIRGDRSRTARANNLRYREELALLDRIQSLHKRAHDRHEAVPLFSETDSADLLSSCKTQQNGGAVELFSEKYSAIFMRDGGEGIVIHDRVLLVNEGADRALRALIEDIGRGYTAAQRVTDARHGGSVDRSVQDAMRLLPSGEELRRRHFEDYLDQSPPADGRSDGDEKCS